MKFANGSLAFLVWLVTQTNSGSHGFSTLNRVLHRSSSHSCRQSWNPKKEAATSLKLSSEKDDVLDKDDIPKLSDYSIKINNSNNDELSAPSPMYTDDEIDEWTQMLLCNPSPLTVDPNIIMPVFCSWCQTCSYTGAALIERILKRYDHLTTNKMYTVAMDAWAKSNYAQCGERAEALLDRMKENKSMNLEMEPNTITYNAVLHAYVKQIFNAASLSNNNSDNNVLEKVERLWQGMEVEKNTITYNNIMAAYARVGNGFKCEQYFQECPKPDLVSYNTLLDAWSKSTEPKAADRAAQILKGMMEKNSNDDNCIQPDKFSYTSVMLAYARSNQPMKAEDILSQMISNEQCTPDVFVYNAILEAHVSNPERATELLSEMKEPNLISYNTVLKAWAKQGNIAMAEQIYDQIVASENIQPDIVTYTKLLNAMKNDAPRAQEYLNQMLEKSNNNDDNDNSTIQPNSVTYNTVLNAWAQAKQPERAEQLLQQMEIFYDSSLQEESDECEDYDTDCDKYSHTIQPNTISYTTVIDAYAKTQSANAAINAERIFQRMEEVYADGNLEAKPNVHSFNAVMNAWAQSGKRGSALRAEDILMKMLHLYESGDYDTRPNVVSFTTVMHGWAKSGEQGSAERAQAIFNLMLKQENDDARPNAISYSTLMDAWIQNKLPANAELVWNQLVKAFRESPETNIKPTNIQVTQIMDAWSKSGVSNAGEKAEKLLDQLEDLYETYQDDVMKPNALSYTTAINAWSKSRQFGKGKRGKQILERMIAAYKNGNEDAKPNVFAYTSVMNACAFTIGDVFEKKEALDIASKTYKELVTSKEYGMPNHITYVTFLRVCSHLIPEGPDRISAIVSVFSKCCQHGQVSDLVLQLLANTLTGEEMSEHIGPVVRDIDGKWKLDNIPHEWRRNVKEVRKNNNKFAKRRRKYEKKKGSTVKA